MLHIIVAGGWLMLPILLCSVIALAIGIERFFVLRISRIAPRDLLPKVRRMLADSSSGSLDSEAQQRLQSDSQLGQLFAIIIRHHRDDLAEADCRASVDMMMEQVIFTMERHLTTLGTIARITPLLGLLGTVIGMIRVFNNIMTHGSGNATILAGGISEALVTTAAGIGVAVPAWFLYRLHMRRIEELTLLMQVTVNELTSWLYGHHGTAGST